MTDNKQRPQSADQQRAGQQKMQPEKKPADYSRQEKDTDHNR